MTEETTKRDRHGNAFNLRPISCPTCGPVGETFMGFRGGSHQRNGEGVETRIVACKGCGLIYPNPFPFPESPQTIYGDPVEYFRDHVLDAKIEYYRGLSKEISQRCAISDPLMLDVGAGRGDFMQAAKLEGFTKVDGLELSEATVAFAKKEFGLDILPLTIEEYAKQTDKKYDAIVLNAVLEHVHNPDSFMAAVSKLATQAAVVYLDIPNEPSLLTTVANTVNRLRGRRSVMNLQPTWEPYHVFGFNRRALGALLAKHGFELETVRVYAGIQHLPRAGLVSTVKAIGVEQLMRLANATGTASNMYVWARRKCD